MNYMKKTSYMAKIRFEVIILMVKQLLLRIKVRTSIPHS